MNPSNLERQIVSRVGTFTLQLLAGEDKYLGAGRSFPIHKTFIAPLLKWATECWAYGLDPDSEVFSVAKGILTKKNGKYLVDLSGEPVTGKELFWNSSGGKRGTIVILGPRSTFNTSLMSACLNTWVFDNFLTGHSPAAVRMAREVVANNDTLAFCLPRNNGMDWIDVYVNPQHAAELFDYASQIIPRKPFDGI